MNALDIAAALTTFVLILPAELPDKTFVATLVLATRFPRWPVWGGVIAAFFIQCLIAVAAGSLLTLLPDRVVAALAAVLFAAGAAIMFRGAFGSRRTVERDAHEEIDAEAAAIEQRTGRVQGDRWWPVFATSFAVLFVAEWGDLSQLFTAAQAARTGEPLSVFVGAWLALVVVAGAAVLLGGWLRSRVALHRVKAISGAVLTVLAVVALLEALRA